MSNLLKKMSQFKAATFEPLKRENMKRKCWGLYFSSSCFAPFDFYSLSFPLLLGEVVVASYKVFIIVKVLNNPHIKKNKNKNQSRIEETENSLSLERKFKGGRGSSSLGPPHFSEADFSWGVPATGFTLGLGRGEWTDEVGRWLRSNWRFVPIF